MAAKVQFSLRTIFVVTAVVALVLAEAVAFPRSLANFLGLAVTLLLPSAFLAQSVYAPGAGRAFGIGALSVWLPVFLFTAFRGAFFQIFDAGRTGYCIFWLVTLAGGGVAVLVRWLSFATK